MTRQLHLNAFLMHVGHHEAAWRHPRTTPENAGTAKHYIEIAQTAERGKLDSIFFADGLGLMGNVRYNHASGLEPLTLLAAIAVATERIGLIATASTTYYEPFHLARKFASLDHISGGRAGWNIVTSGTEAEARNFGLAEHPQHADRYRRAAEFVEVATKLWDSWEDGVLVRDKASGLYTESERIHAIEHRGEFFSVAGPLNVPRSPQGHPLLVQAGSSQDGKEFAARYAEAVFTAQQTLADGKAFYADLKSRLAKYGRTGDALKILPGISPIIGSTTAEAKQLEDELNSLIVPEYGLAQLSKMVGLDLFDRDLEGPLPDRLPVEDDINGNKSRFTLVVELARRENLTIRQLLVRLAGGRGHRVIAGTAEYVADQLEEWFTGGAADGFNVMPPYLPGGLDDFVDQVVPILQDRKLFRTEYTGTTLREHYGLPRPASQFAQPTPATVGS
ncbi:MAG: monooxygenase [Actinomycetia bacterium]|nr:monooxygenase [Actinomycetes bacterium]